MEYKDYYSNITEEYPVNWSMDTFKSLTSFEKRVKYCNETLKRLASGSSRIAYKIDDEKVLKLAKNKKGVAQNYVENDYFVQNSYPDIVAKVFDVDENHLWLEMELAKKLTDQRFKEIIGTSLEEVGYYISGIVSINTGERRFKMSDEILNQFKDNEWVHRIINLCMDMDFPTGDFTRISSYGEVSRNGKPTVVIIDLGLSKQVYKDYYSVKYN